MKATPLNIVIAVLVLIVAGILIHWLSYRQGRSDCEAEVARAVEAQKAEDAVTIGKLRTTLSALDSANASAQDQVEAYEVELAKRPDKKCVLSAGDAAEINK